MSSNNVQLPLLGGVEERPLKRGRYSSSNQPKKWHPEIPCQGIDCNNIVPAGMAPARQKHFFCSHDCGEYFDKMQYRERKKSGTVRSVPARYPRPEGKCEGPCCEKTVPAGLVKANAKHYFCSDECNRKYYKELGRQRRLNAASSTEPPKKRTPRRLRSEGPCEGPGCNNMVPAGKVQGQQKRRFCSDVCMGRFHNRRYIIGACLECHGPIYGQKSKEGMRKFCSDEHETAYQRERMFGPTGPFRSLIENHLATTDRYSAATVHSVKGGLCRFFCFAAGDGLTDVAGIRPSTVRRYIASERARGANPGNDIGHLSSLFKDLMADEVIDRTPVIPGIHKQNTDVHSRFPYTEREMAILWDAIKQSSNLVLMVAFAIAEESGLRNSEICKIHVGDIDLDAQTIFVRHPAKKGEQRKVPFLNKAKRCIQEWLKDRDPLCTHDYLLHHSQLGPFGTSLLDDWFKRYLGSEPEPAASFILHRLRHTWACRLINSGMSLTVLQVLGGWKSLKSVQWYAKLRQDTIRREYESAYRTLEQKQQNPVEEVMSMAEFLSMDDAAAAS